MPIETIVNMLNQLFQYIWSNHVKEVWVNLWVMIYLQVKGNIQIQKTYKNVSNGGWRGTTIISNAIGQGEVLMTPIQLAI
jgi:penicillin-binding protein 2